ncbi:hypothetical protein [Halobacterium salinarum]|uniref:hypothetical protein n=1 Tax=Halobacterium salinarum TaxID=2242 RepID=UPI0025525605|nr:hypothetical protein [Halobacterium salinarum]MDL0126301.1 hypothetical protein [Halobacterium salinarum]MDL0145845.1 hypothetical protein [Halobacterium salinarum]
MTRAITEVSDLTDKRRELLKAAVAKQDELPEKFARSQLNAVLYYEDMSGVIEADDSEEEDTLQTTTNLLNKIANEDGYLAKVSQGGGSAFVLDRYADEESGEKVTGVTPEDLREMAHQVLDRNGTSTDLSDVDFGNWQAVIRAVNKAVGKGVLMVKSEPNKYRLTERGIEAIRDST